MLSGKFPLETVVANPFEDLYKWKRFLNKDQKVEFKIFPRFNQIQPKNFLVLSRYQVPCTWYDSYYMVYRLYNIINIVYRTYLIISISYGTVIAIGAAKLIDEFHVVV